MNAVWDRRLRRGSRLTDKCLRIYTTPGEYLNLALLLLAFLTGLGLWYGGGAPFDAARLAMRDVLTLSYTPAGALAAVHLSLVYPLLIYIPLSKMSHYVGKFFSTTSCGTTPPI
ncbi:MAG: hypothetical protein LBS10_07605 [Gracilibacteraceae bacterium]|jgi:nitrate reductase gamma subunit|nr:hypothetical protein [Gracilibacteraceae bacterium]